jgi:CRP-like cAMP-binding protein
MRRKTILRLPDLIASNRLPEMEPSDPAQLLASSPLLAGLDETSRAELVKFAAFVHIDARDAIVVREGEPAESFYIILAGEAEVLKREPRTDRLFPIATLGPGDHFGETALFHAVKRTATIRARSPMTLAMIKTSEVRESPHSYPWLAAFLLALVRGDASRLDRLTKQTVDGLRAEAEGIHRISTLNRLVIYLIASASIYAIGVGLAWTLAGAAWVEPVGNLLYVLLGAVLFWMLKTSGAPRSDFGVRLSERWLRELGESLLITVAMIATLTGLKWILIRTVPAFETVPLFESETLLVLEIVVFYAVLMPLQELYVRGGLQTSLEDIFVRHPRRQVLAIVLSNAAFALLHLHVSPFFAVMGVVVFLLGLPWGWLYARHGSLLGVALSHVLVGLWALRVLGFGSLFEALRQAV